jgi:hypothetical protein
MWSLRNDDWCEHDVVTSVMMWSVRNDAWCEHDVVSSVMIPIPNLKTDGHLML